MDTEIEIITSDIDEEVIDVEMDETETVPEHSVLLTALPESYNEEYLMELKRIPSKTPIEIDASAEFARNRQFSYRGRAAQKHRPRNKANPISGLLRMLNRSLARPPGLNEIVRINPKYNIVLEEKQAENKNEKSRADENVGGSQEAVGPNSEYVFQGQNNETGCRSNSNLHKDPCNSNVYSLRFSTLKPALMKNVQTKWPECSVVPIRDAKKFVVKYFDLSSWASGEVSTDHYLKDEDCHVIVMVGVLLSSKPLRETYMKKICENHRLLYMPSRLQPVDVKKTIYLSDHKGRNGLRIFPSPSSGLNADEIVSGIPCAVKGFSIPGGGFVVADIVWSTPAPCIWPSVTSDNRAEMVFISGLNLCPFQRDSVEIDLITDYLLGLCGSPYEQRSHMYPKTKVFFVGNSYSINPRSGAHSDSQAKDAVTAAELLDRFLDKISEVMEVFIIPGVTDGTEALLPESPFKPILFPRSSSRSTVSAWHNPCRLRLNLHQDDSSDTVLDLVLSSGSNVDEFKKYPGEESALLIGESMLKWGHLNPAAPDLLRLEKSPQKDFFALEDSLPHLYVIGNQSEFGLRRYNSTQIISLPSFVKTHQLATLEVSNGMWKILPMEFNVLLDS